MTVPLQSALLNTGFAGLITAFILLGFFYWRLRTTVSAASLDEDMERYYDLLLSATIGSMFSFIGLFTFLWYVRIVPVTHDSVRIVLDLLQLVFVILVTLVGRELVKTMITIQKRYGL